MRPQCEKNGGAGVKMAKKMKINGRKLKDRGDDLAVIFPARLQGEKLAWR